MEPFESMNTVVSKYRSLLFKRIKYYLVKHGGHELEDLDDHSENA